MIEDVASLFKDYPQIAVFLAIAIGYYIGKLKFFGFSLGSTASVLLAALVIGQIPMEIPSLLKNVAFALFIFTIGYKVGPQFFGSMKSEGIKYAILSVFFAVVGLATAVILAKVFGFDKGTAAGLLGGALTQSSVIGTADGAIHHLSLKAAEQKTLESNVAIAYAITYLFGTAGLILFFKFLPRVIGIDLKKEASDLEKEMSVKEEVPSELFSWSQQLGLRTYLVTEFVGKSVLDLESAISERAEVKRIKRGDQLLEPTPDFVFQSQDRISVVGYPADFMNIHIGKEVDEPALYAQEGEVIDVCVLNPDVVGHNLGELNEKIGRGVFLKEITRQGHEIPLVNDVVVHKCDILRIVGAKEEVEKAIQFLGYPERSTALTDLVMVGFGCMFGTLLGLLAVKIGGIPITLGIGGGVLVAGLIGGFLRSLHPTFGQIPTSSQWLMTDLGLNLFIACIGLVAGPKAVEAMMKMGPSIFGAGILLSLIPHIVTLLFGKYVLRINFVLLLGALTGAGTVTAALNAVKEEADSPLPVLGYTVPYAIGNVLLTVWGTLLVYLV